jgi:type II secretory pathway pseudopilin PulG
MKFFKRATVAIAAISMLGAAAVPVFAFSTPQNQVQAIPAQVVPTAQQAQSALFTLGQRIRAARLAGFTSPTTRSEYLQAQRDFQYGRYDEAMNHANAAAAALPSVPNWVTEAQLHR